MFFEKKFFLIKISGIFVVKNINYKKNKYEYFRKSK